MRTWLACAGLFLGPLGAMGGAKSAQGESGLVVIYWPQGK